MEKKVRLEKGLAVLFLGLCALFADDSVQNLANTKNGLNLEKFATKAQNSGANLQNISANLENSIFSENQSLVKAQNSGEIYIQNLANSQINNLKSNRTQINAQINNKIYNQALANSQINNEKFSPNQINPQNSNKIYIQPQANTQNNANFYTQSRENSPKIAQASSEIPTQSQENGEFFNQNLAKLQEKGENLSQTQEISQNIGKNLVQIQANSQKIVQASSEIPTQSQESGENLAQIQATPQENTAQNDEFADEFDDFEAEFDSFKVNDPLSGYNKMMTSFNVGFYSYVARPVAVGYDFIVPDFLQTAVKNLFTYISMPIRFLGNVLQLKFKEAGTELKRFGINTVFGFFGLIDAASKAGVPIHHADFGLVLAHWGVGSGFHFVLPFLGPSNLRDTLSIPVNWYANPLSYIDVGAAVDFGGVFSLNWLSVGLRGFDIMNELSLSTGALDEIYFNTPNLYPFLRDAYEKRRMELSK